ncbi:carboxypeptidase regulatory-like domain-containing protein [Candidatus Kaiserbacteria bacterium]|nr:carboxypeptidase regulatory-like domain-containing protein [Candidatus Kaiserbacteria bacterium]
MHFRGTHNFLVKICSRSRRRAAQVPKNAHARRLDGQRGVTLLDTLIGSALMLVIFLGIVGVFQLSIDVIVNNKARGGAIALGNERMEYLRSLSYPQIGVIGGIPAGIVPQEETVVSNGIPYTRRTMVLYSDDPGDGLGASDTNGIIADYKTIRVEVNWQSGGNERGVTLVGRVSPFGVETAVAGGTLTINVVNEAASPVSNAQVDIVNASTTPPINIRTYTNIDGIVTFIGAPAASDYRITVSKPGYSSAQTYSVTAENPNPTPRHLTVVDNQTTSASFTIDYVANKTVETFMHIRENSWSDTFSDTSKIDTMSSTTVAGGVVRLTGVPGNYQSPGTLRSISIAPSSLYRWKRFSASTSTPSQTGILFHFYDAGSMLIPESQLPGNAAGFATSSVDLSSISTTTYPQLRVDTTLTSIDAASTPSVGEYSLLYDYGPDPLLNFSFTMRGAKTIGNNPTVYKYDQTNTTGSDARLTLSSIEADTYTLGVATTSGYVLAESCNPQPEVLAPASSQTTRLYVLPSTPHSLLIDVRSSAGALLQDASVRLTETSYDVTKPTSSCGQSFFGSLENASYTATISKSGYQQYSTSVSVNGVTRLSVTLNPQ